LSNKRSHITTQLYDNWMGISYSVDI